MTEPNQKTFGIMTYHASLNHGAMLQAYALTHFLRQHFPEWGVEIVDHRYPAKTESYGEIKGPVLTAMANFCDTALPLSPVRFYQETHAETFQYIQNNYQCAISGSDEIWKFIITPDGQQPDIRTPAAPNGYWLDESITIPKIAYAGTLAESEWVFLPQPVREKMKRILKNYQLIGVRDTRTFHFIVSLCPELMHRILPVPDPVFTLDLLQHVDMAALTGKLVALGVDFEKPTALMLNYVPDIVDFLQAHHYQWLTFRETSFPSINISGLGLSPLEWAALPQLVDFGVSTRMHGLIAFLLANKPCFIDDIRYKTLELCTTFRIPTYAQSLGDLFALWPYQHIAHMKEEYVQQHRLFIERMRRIL